ncbi:MFS transporter [Solihabitans fulvus]|uniref:MFS transporter n=1 Tax=Solihabitans fulvus TaxID=1892852 RepID=A0A5B2WY81_9PSEU|nr:MFS transporter [Solihabitans fulvus]KAA2256923.1 MFS transporter [Solihabitans fulvus]
MTSSPITNGRKWATLVICCLAGLVLAIDMTALHLAIPGLIKDLNPSSTQVLWIADSYGFALAGLLVTMGNLGDRFGRKRLLLTGTVAFAVASALTAGASTPEMLIAARALLGIAGATIMPSTLSLVRNVFTDPKERMAAVGISSGVVGAGIGLGPVISGAILDHFWWGAVFLINVPIMAAVFVAGLVVLPESRNPNPGRVDALSVPLSILGVVGIVYAIKEAARGGVGQTQVLVAAVLGVAGLAVFLRRQTRLAEPLIDVRLFRRAAFSGAIGTNLFAMFAMIAQSLIFAQYFQLVLGWSPLKSGLAGLPASVVAMVGGVLAGKLVGVFGRARLVAIGLALTGVGFLLYMLTGTTPDYPALLAAMLPIGFGMGLALTVTADTVLASVPKERSGAASAISETATELGGALGMAILGSVLNSSYRGGLDLPAGLSGGDVAEVRDSLGGALDSASRMSAELAGQVVDAARHAFVGAMHVAAVSSAGLAAVAALTALVALRRVPKVLTGDAVEGSAEPVAPARV